ncbi:Crp/Fnr family transcriptional regulator [sulfur-oxidizing endosymbiont of Gigantopelta aegis]|uniref:Crp/Fnr family transcriptional regulator n=1 Tax=sulfur-oxidizing endosymbiont of Gigantopelta aegis TaxID=2794934 RepID=UPI0018DDE878|nr:Crp/Fnr family transcriptional regulator [sulfur-oxidizing endosymbiont of Gigantopelta aegis]
MNKSASKLLDVFSDLDQDDQNSLLSFADFLLAQAKQDGRIIEVAEPLVIERPAEERVVAGIKRLSATYPMLKKNTMLDETASLMSEHILKGRSAESVIDELESLFKKRYDAFCEKSGQRQGNTK